LGAAAGAQARTIAALELAVLRGPRPRPGSAGLAHALATLRRSELHGSDPRRKLRDRDLDAARQFVDALGAALKPLEEVAGKQPFAAIAALHGQTLRTLSCDDCGLEAAFAEDDGAELALVFEDIAEQSGAFRVAPADYAELFETAAADRTCRRAGRPGARVRI